MKTLRENLQEIQKSDKTVAEKKEMLIKLGLRPRDIETLEFTGFFNGQQLTFGVEIECLVARDRVHRSSVGTGFNFAYEGYNHTDREGYFKFVPDGSLVGENTIECVSPILSDNEDGFSTLKTCLSVLNRAGAKVNVSCGLHVHVGLKGYKPAEIVNIYKNYQKLERLIDSFMAPSRRGNCRWAKSILEINYDNLPTVGALQGRMFNDRYYKVNPMAYNRHQTVEFRQHQGSVDFDKISMWVKFCCKLVEWSKGHVLEAEVRNISEVPFINAEEKKFFTDRINHFNA